MCDSEGPLNVRALYFIIFPKILFSFFLVCNVRERPIEPITKP